MHPKKILGTAGALYGAGVGALAGARHESPKTVPKKKRWTRRQKVVRGALIGAAAGGLYGVGQGAQVRTKGYQQYWKGKKWQQGKKWQHRSAPGFGFRQKVKPPSWVAGVKTKEEAARRFKQQARKVHPDLGGSTEAMKNLNTEWSKFRKSPDFTKLSAFMPSFFNELDFIVKNGDK